MNVQQILDFLETLAPVSMKYDWDNVGLLCGSANQEVHKILVALDPFEGVCREAAEKGADLLVTHHPLIFHPRKAVTDGDDVGRSILFLAQNGISAINAHTNLDCAPGGVNDVLAETLGLREIRVLEPMGEDEQGRPWGLLRAGTVDQQPLEAFLAQVKARLQAQGLRYVDGGKPVQTVAVGGGACADELPAVLRAGCDTFVTADVRYNEFYDAKAAGVNLIDAGHFATENPVVAVLAAKLRAAFPQIPVECAENHRDYMNFYG